MDPTAVADCELLGWPADGPTLRLDYEVFSYAGKFVMSNTGKAVARVDDEVVAAVAFDEDRTDAETLVIRYVTVHVDYRGRGLGPRLVAFLVDLAADRGYGAVEIHVNNPYSYQALYKAGFEFTGETTGIAELVLRRSLSDRPTDPDPGRYRAGLDRFADRDLSEAEVGFVEEHLASGPPDPSASDE